jgi:hypothetical protein
MRLPDFEEGLLLAALVLGVEREDVEGMIRAERLHQALLGPAAHVDGAPLLNGPAKIAKRLLVECSLGRILPTAADDFRLAWLLTQRAVELSECTWRPPKGHQARLEEFRESLLEGIDPGEPLEQWLREGIQAPYCVTQQDEPRPIHVSSAMHPAPEDLDMPAWANAVDREIDRFFERHGSGETSFTYRPQVFPIEVETIADLLRTIEQRIYTSDGLVVLAPQCSWGAAMELEGALRAMIPTLFIYPEGSSLSSGARAHLEAMGATIYALQSEPDSDEAIREIKNLVSSWLERSIALILGSRWRRDCMQQRCAALLTALRDRRTQMTNLQERHALAAAGIEPERARTILEQPWGPLSAGFPEVVSLANAYGVRTNVDRIVPEPVSDRAPYLTPQEEEALQVFCRKEQLSTEDSIRLAAAGQREIATPGAGRLRRLLTDPKKWKDVWDRLEEAS